MKYTNVTLVRVGIQGGGEQGGRSWPVEGCSEIRFLRVGTSVICKNVSKQWNSEIASLKKIMSYLSSCPHLCHPCPCPHSSRHPCRSLSSSAYIQLTFFSFSNYCHVLVRTHPCHHCHNLRASALATPVTTWRHSHLRAFKNTIFDSTLISQLNFTTAQTHYSLRGQAQHSISKTQKKRYWWKITSGVILWHKICANAKTIPRDICLQIFSHSQIQYPAPWRNQHFCAPSWDSLVTQERK